MYCATIISSHQQNFKMCHYLLEPNFLEHKRLLNRLLKFKAYLHFHRSLKNGNRNCLQSFSMDNLCSLFKEKDKNENRQNLPKVIFRYQIEIV